VAILWNILGVGAYLAQAYMPEEALELLSQGEQDYYNNYPAWATASFAIGVFGGLLGSIALLLRKKIAFLLFTLSLIGQQIYNFFLQDYITLTSTSVIGPIVIIIICFFLMWYSKAQKTSGLLS
jgi:hypothetical protein